MKRRSLEHGIGIGITIVLDEGEDEEAIPHAFRRFLVHSVANGKLEALFADPIFSQHIAFSEAVTGKEKAICSIPLLQALSHEKVPLSKEIVTALHQEHTIRSILKTDDTCRDLNKVLHNFPLNLSKNKSVKDIRLEKQAEAAERTGKLIARQYRQIALHLHPDRHGEAFRNEFDALQVAYEILKDEKSRGDYVDSMIEVIEKCKSAEDEAAASPKITGSGKGHNDENHGEYETAIVPRTETASPKPTSKPNPNQTKEILRMANTAFILAFMAKKEKQDSEWKRYKEKTGRKCDLFLEASIYSQPPKALRLDIGRSLTMKRNGTLTRTVKLPPLLQSKGLQYQDICRSISIFALSVEADKPDRLLLKLEGKTLLDAFDVDGSGWVTAKIDLPGFGAWNVYWLAALEDASQKASGAVVDTPRSSMTEIRCETSKVYESRARMPELIAKARKVYGTIRSCLNQWKGVGTPTVVSVSKLKEIEQKQSYLGRQISNGQDIAESLWLTLEHVGYSREVAFSRQKDLNELVLILEEARIAHEQALGLVQRSQKRQNMKGFKQLVTDLACHEELKLWIQSVVEADIAAAGGTCNRLYQLLMEGKALHSNCMEYIPVLRSASSRHDLFSEKQCNALAAKAEDMNHEIYQPEEANTCMYVDHDHFEMKKSDSNAKIEDLPEVLLQEDVMPLGTTVILHGLKQRSDLNGSSGRYMGIGENGRYNILMEDSCFALKLENFIIASSETRQEHQSPPNHFSKLVGKVDCTSNAVDESHSAKFSSQKNTLTIWTKRSKSGISNRTRKKEDEKKNGKTKEASGKSSNKYTEEIFLWLPERLFPRFVGRKGENIGALAVETRTRMFVDKTIKDDRGHLALRVEGTTSAIDKAKKRFESLLKEMGLEEEKADPKGSTHFNGNVPSSLQGETTLPKNVEANLSTEVIRRGGKSSTNLPLEDKNASTPTSTSTTVCSDLPTTTTKTGTESARKTSDAIASVSVQASTPTAIPESIYVSSSAAGEEASLTSQAAATTPSLVGLQKDSSASDTLPGFFPNKVDSFFLFLREQSCCLKRSPEDFYAFLVEMDVTSIADLVDAIDDNHFLLQMKSHWVKGFKVESLRLAAVESCHSGAALELKIMPGGLGNLVGMSAKGEGAVAEQMLSKDAPIGTKLPSQERAGTPVQPQSNSLFSGQGSFFWGSWN